MGVYKGLFVTIVVLGKYGSAGRNSTGCEGDRLERGRARTTGSVTGVIDQGDWLRVEGRAQPHGPFDEAE